MRLDKPHQSIFEFDFFEDLEIYSDCRIGVDKEGNPEYITLEVNGKEVSITGEAAESIFDAVKIAVNYKIKES